MGTSPVTNTPTSNPVSGGIDSNSESGFDSGSDSDSGDNSDSSDGSAANAEFNDRDSNRGFDLQLIEANVGGDDDGGDNPEMQEVVIAFDRSTYGHLWAIVALMMAVNACICVVCQMKSKHEIVANGDENMLSSDV